MKTVEDFDFKFQPGVDARLVKELATGRFVENAEHVLLFRPPGVGKTHLAIALGRAVVEAGHSVLFTSTVSLIAALAKASQRTLAGRGGDKHRRELTRSRSSGTAAHLRRCSG